MNNQKIEPSLKGPDKISKITETPPRPRRDHSGKRYGNSRGEQQTPSFSADGGTFSGRQSDSKYLWVKVKDSNQRLLRAARKEAEAGATSSKLGLYEKKK